MIVDNLKNLNKYSIFNFDIDHMREFIELYHKEELTSGRYDLNGNRLFALVQKYTTKNENECFPESHLEYIDIQVILKGVEVILWDHTEDIKIVEDLVPGQDIRFHEKKEEKGQIILHENMFAIFFPSDAHTPCITWKEPSEVQKIVFKVKV